MNRSIRGVAASLAVLAVGLGALQASAEGKEGGMSDATTLKGVWVATVDPLPTPGGDQPPFESTLAYDASNVVNEITTRATMTSAGLGTWVKVGAQTYRASWHKYRFDATGAYVGRTLVTEEITVTGPATYTAHSVTKVISSTGAVVAQFESDASAERMR